MKKHIDYKKLSKKAKKLINKKSRVAVQFNTGTRIHKTSKHPNRQQRKRLDRQEQEE